MKIRKVMAVLLSMVLVTPAFIGCLVLKIIGTFLNVYVTLERELCKWFGAEG